MKWHAWHIMFVNSVVFPAVPGHYNQFHPKYFSERLETFCLPKIEYYTAARMILLKDPSCHLALRVCPLNQIPTL